MRVSILPCAREVLTLHQLKDRGFSISSIRTRKGKFRNVATAPLPDNIVTLPQKLPKHRR